MIKIKVPATSANMGPGFDTLGIALDIYNEFTIEEIDNSLEFIGFEEAFMNKNNLVYTSMMKTFDVIGYNPKGLRIGISNNIPVSRGLGSSAACILGGVIGANELAGQILNKQQILEIATELDGHPDNIAPALLGGMTTAVKANDEVYCDKISLSKGVKLCALIPNFHLATKKARAALPTSIPHADGVFNVGRVALLVTALANGNLNLVKVACEDKLHEPYRGNLIADYYNIIQKGKSLNPLGIFLSGAGPTIMVLLKDDDVDFSKNIASYLNTLENSWEVKELNVDYSGSVVSIV